MSLHHTTLYTQRERVIMRFRLDVEPVGKGRPRLGKKHVYTPSKTKVFEEAVKALTSHLTPLEGCLKVEFIFVFKRPKSMSKRDAGRQPKMTRPDTDNLIKSTCDALNGQLYNDDAQVVDVRGQKFYAAIGEEPHIEVICSPYMEHDDTESIHAREGADKWGTKTKKIEVVLTALEQGMTLEESAEQAKISRTTLYRWRKEIEGLDEAIDRASGLAEIYLVNAIKASGEEKNDWRAFAWLLERRFPESWGQRSHLSIQDSQRQEQHERSNEMIRAMIEQSQGAYEQRHEEQSYDAVTVVRAGDLEDVPF